MSCETKTKYANEKFANDELKLIKKRSNRETIPLRAYLCNCGFWHLTSKGDAKSEHITELLKENRELNEKNKELELKIKKLEQSTQERRKIILKLKKKNG